MLKLINWKSLSLAACFILLLLQLGFIFNNLWTGDFWEHIAVLRELTRNPLHPVHPILKIDVPHAFFSPYMVTLGLAGHYLKLNSLTILNIVSVFNLLFFFYCFFLLSKMFIDQINPFRGFLLLLITHLLFWGIRPWGWSGFYHLGTLNYVLPYPSTFSFCLSILSAHLYNKSINRDKASLQKISMLMVVIFLNWVIILTHPLTFIFTITLFIFILLKSTNVLNIRITKWLSLSNLRQGLYFTILLVLPVLLTAFWPYYPFFNLFTSAVPGDQFHIDNEDLYSQIYIRIFPVGIIFVLLYLKGWKFIIDNLNLFVLLIILLLIYVYGFFTQSYGYGRVISYFVLYCHVLLIPYLISIWNNRKYKKSFFTLYILLSLPYLFYNLLPIIHRSVPFIAQKEVNGTQVKFIEKHLKYDQVVLSDNETSRFIPAFGGRVIASLNPPYWIKDNEQRMNDAHLFFNTTNLDSTQREKIIEKYSVDFILLNKDNFPLVSLINLIPNIERNTVFKNNQFILIKIKRSRS